MYLSPPDNVKAGITSDFIHVTWDSVPAADHYEVYRRTGTGDFELVTETLVSTTAWKDFNFPRDTILSYTVKSEKDGEFSGLSEPGNSVIVQTGDVVAENTRVSVLEYKL